VASTQLVFIFAAQNVRTACHNRYGQSMQLTVCVGTGRASSNALVRVVAEPKLACWPFSNAAPALNCSDGVDCVHTPHVRRCITVRGCSATTANHHNVANSTTCMLAERIPCVLSSAALGSQITCS
jgi:hypothetical protein